MTTFVLVHGAWSSGWDWLEVAANLCADGHRVHTPTLTGLGERSHVTGVGGTINLNTHIEDVVALLEWHDLREVVLVGHSYAGLVIAGAAARASSRIRTLFYLDAFVPADGQSLADLTGSDAWGHLEALAHANGGDVPPLVRPRDAPYGPRAEAYAERLRPMPLACFTQPVRLTRDEATIPNRVYLYADTGLPTSRTRFYEAVRENGAWRSMAIDAGHLVMIDEPRTLTHRLLEAAMW